MTLLDALVETIIDGRGSEVVFTVIDTVDCLHPDVAGDTGYKYGCRCVRCRSHHSYMANKYKRRHR